MNHYCTGEDCRYCQALIERAELDREERKAEELPLDCWPALDR